MPQQKAKLHLATSQRFSSLLLQQNFSWCPIAMNQNPINRRAIFIGYGCQKTLVHRLSVSLYQGEAILVPESFDSVP